MIFERIAMQTNARPGNMRFADTWLLRDGLIAIRFAGMVQYSDGTVA